MNSFISSATRSRLRYVHSLATFVIVYGVVLVDGSEFRKPCKYTIYESDTSIRYPTSLDADISCAISENQAGCEINLGDLYKNVSILNNSKFNQQRKELFVTLKLYCNAGEIHFTSSLEANDTETQISVGVDLMLIRCSVFLAELQAFKKYGRILAVTQTNTTRIYPHSNCSGLRDLQSLVSHLPCDFRNRSSTDNDKRIFWEFCELPFEDVYSLYLEGCLQQKYEVNPDLLRRAFPNLQTLQLKYVSLTRFAITFPWTHIYTNTPKDDIETFYLFRFDSTTKNSSSFDRKLEISTSDVNISDVKLDGDIHTIKINDAHLKRVIKNTFRMVRSLILLDLSNNNLLEIDENAFQMQTKLNFLYLKNNMLTFLQAGVLNSLHNLLVLDLSCNKLLTVNQNNFKYLLNLKELNLESNEIKQLPGDFLKDQIISLCELKLSHNPLEMIPIYPLYGYKLRGMHIRNCSINSEGFQSFIRSLDVINLHNSYASSSGQSELDYSPGDEPMPARATLDISFNKIKDIDTAWTGSSAMAIQQLIWTFHIKLTGNPIDCKCMSIKTRILYQRIGWTCMFPPELKGRLVKSVTADESYCPVIVTNCPKRCSCYKRYNEHTFIVDCRNINITSLPEAMPPGKLELWFQNASLNVITARDYFRNTTVLDASHNRINEITPSAVIRMANVISLKLDHNNLTRLPMQIISTHIRKLALGNNPFLCDCHTRWMKKWLLKRTSPVTDWNAIECSYNTSKVNQMITVSDSFFVCHSRLPLSISEHVIFPAIVIGCTLFVLVSLSLLIYFQRFTIKVLLFMNFGIHSFDKQKHKDANMEFDAFVLYSRNDSPFVSKNIIETLKKKGYNVCNLYEDLVVGFTFLDNIEHMIKKSRKIIFSVTEDTLTNNLLMSAWNIAYERAINNLTDSIILVVDTEITGKCEDDKLRKYIRSGKFIKKKSNILQSSILYLMPKHTCVVNDSNGIKKAVDETCIAMTEERDNFDYNINNGFVYISHHEEHDDDIRKLLIPDLQVKNYDVRVFENAFIPGTDIRDEINEKLDVSDQFIFILSQKTLQDEVKMFILSTVISKSVLSNDNYLLLFTSGTVDSYCMPNEVENYLNKYVTGRIADPMFKLRLLKALRYRL